MTKKMVADGSVTIREKKFFYEFWSDSSDVTVKIFLSGKKGESTEYIRDDKINLKKEMEAALLAAKVFKR
ncbi:MAG: hypothetical protein ABI772_00730 [Bacteroidota bacterium]